MITLGNDDEEYLRKAIIQKMPRLSIVCDQTAARFSTLKEYERSKRSPHFEEAFYGYTRAMWFCRRDVPLVSGFQVESQAEHFLECVKMGGKEFMGEAYFEAGIAWLRENGLTDYLKRVRKALKNRRNYKPTSAFEVPLKEAMLTLWFPLLLWLMDDNLAVLVLSKLEVVQGSEKDFPFRGLKAVRYERSRQRLQTLGLKSWLAYYDRAPIRDWSDGEPVFAPAEECGGFDFQAG